NWFFTTSEVANANLRRQGVAVQRICFVGNTMIDTLLTNLGRLRPPPFSDEMGLQPGQYFVVTLHRPANVDASDPFARMLEAIAAGTRGLPVIFPVHPRTAKTLQTLPGFPPSLHLVDPQPYLEFNWLVKHAKAVITDSGGITEEATVMGVRWLRPGQVYGRLRFRLHRPRPDLKPAPALRPGTGTWTGCARTASMTGPDTFRFLNVERCIAAESDWNRPDWPKLWLYNAHYF